MANMIPHAQHAVFVRAWLLSLMALVVLMIFIGGVTRLTESGLSIVEWKLFSGIFPPLTQEGWEREFAEYQQSPEFTQKNFDFGVAEFKRIYWLEYIHRLLGRVVGLAFLLPFGYFLIRKALPPALIKRMAIATVLVGMQGLVGWIMVKSGLEDSPRVHPLKLAMHLSLALSLFGLLLWTWWQVHARSRYLAVSRPFWFMIRLTFVVIIVQVVLGALVAGNDAGLTYNTYPLMDGRLIPSSLGHALANGGPWVANTLIVQFFHRLGAHLLAGLCIVLFIMGMRYVEARIRYGVMYIAAACGVQFLLGVLTLIHVVPIGLASAHQMAAIILIAAILNLIFLTTKPQPR
ncbi:MAG: heme A synthase [Alphaproteobacteria bacterium]|nr:heme A synthase [Alphaproteobacteria bacterium]